MTKYFWMNTRSLLTNPYLIFFSIFFCEFWVLMTAFVFGSGVPQIEEAMRMYVAAMWGLLLVISLSTAASSIGFSLLYSSKSIRYVTKFTKLSPSRFLLENMLSCFTVLAIISVIMFFSVVLAFYAKLGTFLLPEDGAGLIFGAFLGILFIYALSLFLNLLVVVLRAPESASFVTFLPMLLGFFFSFAALYLDLGVVAYISPFNCLVSMCYYFFSGNSAPTGNYLMTAPKSLMDMTVVVTSLIIWVVLILVMDVVLLRKMRGVGVEDIRVA